CCLSLSRGRVLIWREAGRAGLPELTLKPGRSAMWDGRYHVEIGPDAPGPVIVRALGEDGWREIRPLKPEKPGGSAQIAHGCISFWRRGELLAVPHIAAVPQPAAPIRATFLGTLVSRPGAPAPW
ncbi:MAG TPA: hypothetical protein VK844_02365, partial [Hyphomicrobiales bacterium]|nr:hypothetical protein [Hyphomicrobiales bacterium]